MKLPDSYLQQLEQSDQPKTEQYLRYGKLDSGATASFALLEEDPFCYWLAWATPVAKDSEEKGRPFRFIEKPSDKEIEIEIGRDYERALDFNQTGPRKPEMCFTWPVYNWDVNQVQVLEVPQVSLRNQFAKFGLNKKYKNILDWDFELTKIKTDRTRYDLMIVPRDTDEHDEDAMAAAWKQVQKAGFDLQELLRNESGANPFEPAN